jgi:hypothetical protein
MANVEGGQAAQSLPKWVETRIGGVVVTGERKRQGKERENAKERNAQRRTMKAALKTECGVSGSTGPMRRYRVDANDLFFGFNPNSSRRLASHEVSWRSCGGGGLSLSLAGTNAVC